MNDDFTVELELDVYSGLETEGFVGVAASNSAIAAVGPGPGPGNSAIAAVGPGPGVSAPRGGTHRATGPLVSWSHVAPINE
jgi:hypothetical protein